MAPDPTSIDDLLPGIETRRLVQGSAVAKLRYKQDDSYSWADSRNPKRYCRKLLCDDALSRIGDAVRDTVLIDIGCGPSTAGYALARLTGASSYIGVDHHHTPRTHERILADDFLWAGNTSTPWTLVHEDLLAFLARVPDASASLLACGIDRCMIPELHEVPHTLRSRHPNISYLDALREECNRVLHPRGSLISFYSFLTHDPGQDVVSVFTVTRAPSSKVVE